MIHFYFGTDTTAARAAGLSYVEERKHTGARIERCESEMWSESLLSEVLGATSLFGEVMVYVFDTPSDDGEFFEIFNRYAAELAATSNTVVVLERTLLAPLKKKWTTVGAQLHEFVTDEKKTSFDVFRLADALSQRDKKNLWVLYTTARIQGLSAEELIGTLWWQLKTLRLAAMTTQAAEAGMKDFPYNKAKRALAHFKPGEIEQLSRTLLMVYHDGHGGVRDIDLSLEEWVLRV